MSVAWQAMKDGHHTVFVSKDLNARVRADAIGLIAEDFESEKVDAGRLYSGYRTIDVDSSVIDELYTERQITLESLEERVLPNAEGVTPGVDLYANEFALLRDAQDQSHTGLARRLADTNHIIPVSGPRRPTFGIMARNLQQTMALDLLLDDDIQLVTLLGGAGTGKTLLALAAGMTRVFNEERYDRLLVARPIMPLGRDIGYLPGDKDEKLAAWMQPIFDNLTFLMSNRGSRFESAESHSTEQRVEKLIAERKLVMEPITYIRGRSIPHQFMIIDEAQNLTPHEVKTITSRVGEGTKIVLTGDIRQIDNPYLDDESNGLSYLVERLKHEGLVGHVMLAKSERSELARLIGEML
jgi:PhoH-like ATPase